MCRFFVPLALALTSLAGSHALAQPQGMGMTAPMAPPPGVSLPLAAPLAPPVAPASAVGPPLTLAGAIRIALDNNPEIQVARREIDAAQGARIQAGVFPNPTLAAQIEDPRRDSRTSSVLLSQPFELGGQRAARIEAAERAFDVARVQLEARQVELRASVTAAFFVTLTTQDRVQLAQSSLELAARGSLAASNRVRAGKVSPLEETRARVAEAGVRLELVQAQGELQTQRQQLGALLGRPALDQTLDGNALTMPGLPSIQDVEARLPGAPASREAQLQVQRFAALANVERARRIPDITVTAGGQRDQTLGRNQAIVGISIPLPIFDTNRGNIAQAVSRRYQAEDQAAATALRLRSDAATARQRYANALAEVDTLQRDILPGALTAFNAATTGFELGKFAFLDVLDAQRTLLLARAQYLRALAEAHRSVTDIDRLLGDPALSSGLSLSNP
jgi:cobalt-zinc-cadmium efflux system outer membrane protein